MIPRKPFAAWPLAGLVVLVSTIAGCASSASLVQKGLGSPEKGGLVVIRPVLEASIKPDANYESIKRQLLIGETRLPSTAMLHADIQRIDGGRQIRGSRTFAGLLVFPELEPGTYVLRSLDHSREIVEHLEDWQIVCDKRDFKLDGPADSILFEVRSGQATYVGRLELQAYYETDVLEEVKQVMLGGTAFSARLVRRPDDEAQAWEEVLARAPQSPWAPAMSERVQALRQNRAVSEP